VPFSAVTQFGIAAFRSVLILVFAMTLAVRAADRPNIVMIISDDQSWTDYSFMGHPDIQTPHIDALAERSAVFRRGYVPTALCRPSLATMITGLYPSQHRISGNDPARTDGMSNEAYADLRARLIGHIDEHPTLPRLLGDNGYQSHQSGKWWEGNWKRGGFTAGMSRGFPQPRGRHGDDGLDIGRKGMQPIFDFVDAAVADDDPFMLWYAPFLPHTPHNPPERILKKYQRDDRPEALAKYYAMCDWFDETVGQLTTYLDARNLTDNTLVVYVTDNGWIQRTPETQVTDQWRHSFAPRSKQSPNEGGTRTPIMFSWPGVIPPGEHPELVSSIDLMPTLLAAAGADIPDGLPGLNLMKKLKENGELDRNFLYGESYAHDVADVDDPEASLLFRWGIEGNWKLILSYPGASGRYGVVHAIQEPGPQLYDLSADPHETKNVAAAHPQIVQRIAAEIQSTWDVSMKPRGL